MVRAAGNPIIEDAETKRPGRQRARAISVVVDATAKIATDPETVGPRGA